MAPLLSVAAALASLAATYLFLPWLIRSLHGTSAMGKDLNKPHKPLVPEMGGLAVILGFSLVFAVALGVTSAGNAANMLEGLNGLGSGLAVIITTTLIVLSILEQADEGLFLLFPLLGALLAFLWFNRYPARVFPGDSMTLFSGAAIASAAVISSPPLKTVGAFLF